MSYDNMINTKPWRHVCNSHRMMSDIKPGLKLTTFISNGKLLPNLIYRDSKIFQLFFMNTEDLLSKKMQYLFTVLFTLYSQTCWRNVEEGGEVRNSNRTNHINLEIE